MGQTQPLVSRRLPQSVIINLRHQKTPLNLLTITKCYNLNKCTRDIIQGDSSQRRFPVRPESPFLISLTFLQIGPKAVRSLCLPMLWSALYLQAILETVRSHQQSMKRLVRVGSLFCRQDLNESTWRVKKRGGPAVLSTSGLCLVSELSYQYPHQVCYPL